MLKQLFISLFMMSVCKLECMEASDLQIQKVPEQAICHLARLPKEVSNYIAYLAFEYESETEFIERIKNKEKVPYKYFDHLCTPITFGIRSDGAGVALCPDGTKLIFAELIHGGFKFENIRPTLTIIDNKKQTLYREDLSLDATGCVALSRCGHLYASAQTRIDNTPRRTEEMRYKYVLIIKNIFTKDIKEYSLARYADSMNFNKQGDQIAIHATDGRHCLIFPIDQCTECAKAKQKTLEEYFVQYQVCKKL